MAKLVSKTYGDALFELALEENKVDSILEEAVAVRQVFAQNEELVKLLNHPKVIKEEKITVVENIFKDRISDDFVGFLTLIVRKGRYGEIIPILDYFILKVKEYKNIGIADVTSAAALSASQKEAVKTKLLATTKYVEIEMNYTIDETIIGGMIIRIGDRVIDSSIKTKIAELSKNLYKIQLS